MSPEMWAEMMRGETDEARLRAAYPNLPLVEEICAALLAARQMVDVTERYDRAHESLAMTLRYAQLTKLDVSRKFRRASPLDNLRAGR